MRFAPNIQKHPFAFYVGLFFVLIFSYTLFAVISSFLPDRMVKHRVKMASKSLAAYGNYPRSVFDLETCQQDYFTESLILNQVYCIDRTKPLESAMMVRWKFVTLNLPGGLWQMTHEGEVSKDCSYPRYWHGTTFLTRFLLLFFSYAQIQWLFFAVSLLLMLAFGKVYGFSDELGIGLWLYVDVFPAVHAGFHHHIGVIDSCCALSSRRSPSRNPLFRHRFPDLLFRPADGSDALFRLAVAGVAVVV